MQHCLFGRLEISDNSTQSFAAYGGQYSQSVNPDDHGTSHLSVVDSERGSVAMTTTINTGFGSKIISSSTGQLNNRNQLLHIKLDPIFSMWVVMHDSRVWLGSQGMRRG